MILAIENFAFKIENGRFVENSSPEKKQWCVKIQSFFKKLVRNDNKEKFYYKKH